MLSSGGHGNYLRVRGEYMRFINLHGHTSELPPRTRRIRVSCSRVIEISGTTSAYAENTMHERNALSSQRNYLRVRGEY